MAFLIRILRLIFWTAAVRKTAVIRSEGLSSTPANSPEIHVAIETIGCSPFLPWEASHCDDRQSWHDELFACKDSGTWQGRQNWTTCSVAVKRRRWASDIETIHASTRVKVRFTQQLILCLQQKSMMRSPPDMQLSIRAMQVNSGWSMWSAKLGCVWLWKGTSGSDVINSVWNPFGKQVSSWWSESR